MPSERKFYRTVIRYEILSEEPIPDTSLEDYARMTEEGDCSGTFLESDVNNEVLSAEAVVEKLIEHGSEPGFFQLDEDGEDLDEYGVEEDEDEEEEDEDEEDEDEEED